MRIAFVVGQFPLRSETFVLDQIIYFIESGHQVGVFADRIEDISILNDDQRLILGYAKLYSTRLNVKGARLLHSRVQNFIAQGRLSFFLKSFKADVIIAHFGWNGAKVAKIIENNNDLCPLITIYHGRDVASEWKLDRMSGYQKLFRFGSRHICVNKPFAELLISAGASAGNVDVLHLGVPSSRYTFRLPSPKQTVQIVSVCRLVEKKGLSHALDALSVLSNDYPHISWRYDIGGEGPQLNALSDKAQRLGLASQISFLGPMRHDETLALLAKADILLQPSITAEDGDQEGIPVVIMEAMAIGTIVCSTKHSGIPELVEHDVTGLLSDEGSAADLAQNIRRATDGSLDLAEFALAARLKIEQCFNSEIQMQQLELICQNTVEKHRTGSPEVISYGTST